MKEKKTTIRKVLQYCKDSDEEESDNDDIDCFEETSEKANDEIMLTENCLQKQLCRPPIAGHCGIWHKETKNLLHS